METDTHVQLKHAAVHRLFADGCAAAAVEVQCPIARFRVDAAGYLDPLPAAPLRRERSIAHGGPRPPDGRLANRAELARTVIVECKASRADFFIDSRDAERLVRERDHLNAVRAAVEEQFVKTVEPHLRRSGSSLFVDLEEWDLAQSRLPSYRRLLDDLRSVDERLHGQSKFWTIARYALADFLYIAAPAGVVRPHELPRGWGLLEAQRRPDPRDPDLFQIAVPAPHTRGNPRHRQRMLRNIAVASSRRAAARMPLRADPLQQAPGARAGSGH